MGCETDELLIRQPGRARRGNLDIAANRRLMTRYHDTALPSLGPEIRVNMTSYWVLINAVGAGWQADPVFCDPLPLCDALIHTVSALTAIPLLGVVIW